MILKKKNQNYIHLVAGPVYGDTVAICLFSQCIKDHHIDSWFKDLFQKELFVSKCRLGKSIKPGKCRPEPPFSENGPNFF
jgi:hypothetical protein